MEGHTNEVQGVGLLSAGRAVSWSEDGTVRVWDFESGKCLMVLNQMVKLVIVLDDDKALFWAGGEILQLWDLNTMHYLESYDDHTLHAAHEDIWRGCLGKERVVLTACLVCEENKAMLGIRPSIPDDGLYWFGTSECWARHLFADGRAIVTQANGQVCILRIYHGSKRVALNDMLAVAC